LDFAKCQTEPPLEGGGDVALAFLKRPFRKISGILQLVAPTTFLIVDSTLLVDLYDMEACWGHTSGGKFGGFRLHAAVN
jgi:hypothetical protein